ncbi:MAG: M23 family metallopeptidase [Gordonia sp. (in: high G+C Gram-positive bacteria)]|uniref:M23 family metallopeptidase n=1 Tax=Gordonia sp. (in: high G+C Gram-positive bacteria) TaxID=84139 RepID=UPI0039E2DD0A
MKPDSVWRVVLVAVTVFLWVTEPSAVAATGRYGWPLDPRPAVVRGFDPPVHRWEPGHRGIDLAASAGSAVLAAGVGTVRFAGSLAGRPVVSVLHPDGIVTTYEPVTARVRAGDRVRRGEVLGLVEAGHPGCRSSACLHWGARRGAGSTERYLDPRTLVGGVRVRLKPFAS